MATIKEVVDSYKSGTPIAEMEERLGISHNQIYATLKAAGVACDRKRGPMQRRHEYALYDTKDTLLFCGNSDECSDYLGIARESFYRKLNRQHNGLWQKIYIVELSSEE